MAQKDRDEQVATQANTATALTNNENSRTILDYTLTAADEEPLDIDKSSLQNLLQYINNSGQSQESTSTLCDRRPAMVWQEHWKTKTPLAVVEVELARAISAGDADAIAEAVTKEAELKGERTSFTHGAIEGSTDAAGSTLGYMQNTAIVTFLAGVVVLLVAWAMAKPIP